MNSLRLLAFSLQLEQAPRLSLTPTEATTPPSDDRGRSGLKGTGAFATALYLIIQLTDEVN